MAANNKEDRSPGPGFVSQGVFAQKQIEADELIPRQGRIPEGATLAEMQSEFTFILPYVMVAVLPTSPIEPMAQCYQHLKIPSQWSYWDLETELVNLGRRGREIGLRTNRVFGFPVSEQQRVLNFLRSIMVVDPYGGSTWMLRIQSIQVLDPMLSASRPIDNVRDYAVPMFAFALDFAAGDKASAIYLEPSRSIDGVPLSFHVRVDNARGDKRLLALDKAFRDGADILQKDLNPYDDPAGG